MGGARDRTPGRVRFWIIVLAVLALTIPLLASYRPLWGARAFPAIVRTDGELATALETLEMNRMVNIYVGLAAREVVDGPVETVHGPDDLGDLADREDDAFQGKALPALIPLYVEHSSGGALVASDHDPVLSEAQLARLTADAELVEFPNEVFAVVGEGGADEVFLFTDEMRHDIYVVPGSLVPEGSR